MVTLLQKPQLSKVNARHLLDDLADSYSYLLEEAVLVELIANALDAKCRQVSINADVAEGLLTIEDDGTGMNEIEFQRYHDLAESRKERGRGIGFAGLGAKLAHKVAAKVISETRSTTYQGASEWQFKGDDLEWKPVRRRTLKTTGTRITLRIERQRRRMLSEEFIITTIKRHYGPLLDTFLSQIYIWESIYPDGVTFMVNGKELDKCPLTPDEVVQQRTEIDVYSSAKKRVGRAVFILTRKPMAENEQGIALATYGKVVRRDHLNIPSREPHRIVGWFESPALVECLTTNKQDFIDHDKLGDRFRRIRRELQHAFEVWLKDIGQAPETGQRQRAPRQLEAETAKVLRQIPELRFLFARRTIEDVVTPNSPGDTPLMPSTMFQQVAGTGSGTSAGEGDSVYPGDEEGPVFQPAAGGTRKGGAERRSLRGTPRIVRVADAARMDIGWVDGDSIVINTGHPTYTASARQRHTSYHERVAVYYALCQEAPIPAERRLSLFNQALTEWGKV